MIQEPYFNQIVATCEELGGFLQNDECRQSTTELVPLYYHASNAFEQFQQLVTTIEADGIIVQVPRQKKLYRIIEEMNITDDPELGCGLVTDVVRAQVICQDSASFVQAIQKVFQMDQFTIHRLQEG